MPLVAEWIERNPLYKKMCWLAWRSGESTFRAFIDDDASTRLWLSRNFFLLDELFNSSEFNPSQQ